MLPYIISEDLESILVEGKGEAARQLFKNPKLKERLDKEFIDGIRAEYKQAMSLVFSNLVIVKEDDLRQELNKKIAEAKNPVVTLDRLYVDNHENIAGYFDITRARVIGNDNSVSKKHTLRSVRTNKADIVQKLDDAYDNLKRKATMLKAMGINKVDLLDDVLFHGKTLTKCIFALESSGVSIGKIITGISIGTGEKELSEKGYEIEALSNFDEVIDEVCERDFFIGIPQSGLIEYRNKKITTAPYITPFGDIKNASIPDEYADFISYTFIDLSIKIWQELENRNKSDILVSDLSEKVSQLENGHVRVVDELIKKRSKLKPYNIAI